MAEDPAGPAEAKLAEHLALLRAEAPRPGTALTHRVVRTARWQRALRSPLRVVGMIAAGIADGAAALLGFRRRPR